MKVVSYFDYYDYIIHLPFFSISYLAQHLYFWTMPHLTLTRLVMYRPGFTTLGSEHTQAWHKTIASLIAPITIWICVLVCLKYGFYGDCGMSVGPSTSRFFQASSLFVEQVGVRDVDRKEVILYGFSDKPQLSSQTNWNVTSYQAVLQSYCSKGFYLWLNKGSSIHMRWELPTSTLGQIEVSLLKGEQRYDTLQPTSRSYLGREVGYNIEEDDGYYVSIANLNPRTINMVMNATVSSKMYDVTKAKSMCSTTTGSCHLNLDFPSTQFVVVTTPNNGDLNGWYLEISFVARIITYFAILGLIAVIILIFFKYLGGCEDPGHWDEEEARAREVTETSPLLPEKTLRLRYGTGEEDVESNTSGSSEDLYDGMICVICYDKPRNSFFVPCGHCATCYDCAQRIMEEGERKVCPICRRLVHKLGKLIIP